MFPLYVIALIAASFHSDRQRSVNLKPLSFLLILGAINLYLSKFNPIVLSAFINFSFGVIFISLVANYTQNFSKCLKYAVLAGVFNLAILGSQLIGFDPIITNIAEPGGIFGNAPRLCMYLMIILPFAWKVNPIFFFLFVVTSLFLGEKVVLIFAPMVMMGFLYKKCIKLQKGFWIISIIMFSCLGFIMFFNKIIQSFIIRLPIWKSTIEQIFQRPVEGFGLGMFPHVSGQFIIGYYHADTAFSSLLDFTFGIGLISSVIILTYIGRVTFNACFKYIHKAEVLAFLSLGILCFVEYPFEVPKLWPIICSVIAIFLITQEVLIEKRTDNL